MEKKTITFSANEQKLIKTGGMDCYASNTVAYIEAHFDLGENWSGYDSVRAVWSNDNNMTVISTVLDSNGVCVVPFEVLKTKGVVKVNLVGSISVSDVLTDRLTTFPCEAVKVTAKAKIEGSETQPITPSQFEQFVAAVISEVEKVTGMTAQAETLPAGAQATARYENGILYLGIPQGIQGERGETGADGNGIASVVYNADYTLTLVFDNGERFTTPPIRGERGPAGADGRDGTDGADGVTPNISIGNVETLEPSEDAYVTRRGTDANPIFDFGIPKGDKGDTGEVTMSQLSSLLPTDTASGAIASFPDGQSVIPALSVKAEIEPIQDLHGYDKPWGKGAGKNTFPAGAEATITTNGVTFTSNGNGVYTLSGTATATAVARFYLSQSFVIQPSNTHKVAFMNSTSSVSVSFVFFNGTTQVDSWSLSPVNRVATSYATMANKECNSIGFQVVEGATVNMTVSPMMTLQSADVTTFEPYSNICPISGHTEVVTIVSPTTDAEDGTTYTTTLGRTVYGGTLDVVSGVLTVTHGIVDLGEPNYSYYNNRFDTTLSDVKGVVGWNQIYAICSALDKHPIQPNSTDYDGSFGIYNKALFVRYNEATSVAELKTALSGVQLCYELATPQTYQLTPQEVQLLLGQNNLWTDCGSVEVTYKADVGLYIDKKLSSNGTRSLSMGLTKSAMTEAETETKTVEAETEEVKAEPSKTETETEAVEAKTETDKSETR